MKKYTCELCGYESDPAVGDPDNGIAPGTPFDKLPEDWVCPVCGLSKEDFTKAQIVEAIKTFIPNFEHEEKGKNLDQKM